ncbi:MULTISPECIES: hypothetical protein [unclassified Streptomyces]|uniref:hypothetical protein n=1 Tax=unclassified Streptomyces TaxID=2593676 RepID=UPI002E104E4B|nr:hypothetical protein OG395_23240 [Streptomyces sp. NBC_01320]
MKQSAARTLGVAALGAAFAAAAAGTASASALPVDAASALPVAGSALGTATRSLPVQDTATKLLGSGQTKVVHDATSPLGGLLGGLPAGGVKANGLSTNGLPLGG